MDQTRTIIHSSKPEGMDVLIHRYLVCIVVDWIFTMFVHILTQESKFALPWAFLASTFTQENLKKTFCLKMNGLELIFSRRSIALWPSIKFVQIIAPGPKLALLKRSFDLHTGETLKNLLKNCKAYSLDILCV